MKEIRLHGRGGQGAAKGAEMLTMAFIYDGKYAASFPMYGAARRGGLVSAFCRFDEQPVREKTMIYNPDCLVVFDPLMKDLPEVYEGFKLGGTVILNTAEKLTQPPHKNVKTLGLIDATRIAAEELGLAATNTAILAAIAATTKWVTIEAVIESFAEYFKGPALDKNIKCARRGYSETKVIEY